MVNHRTPPALDSNTLMKVVAVTSREESTAWASRAHEGLWLRGGVVELTLLAFSTSVLHEISTESDLLLETFILVFSMTSELVVFKFIVRVIAVATLSAAVIQTFLDMLVQIYLQHKDFSTFFTCSYIVLSCSPLMVPY